MNLIEHFGEAAKTKGYQILFEKILLSIGEIEANRHHSDHFKVVYKLHQHSYRTGRYSMYIKYYIAKQLTEAFVYNDLPDDAITLEDFKKLGSSMVGNFTFNPLTFFKNTFLDSIVGKNSTFLMGYLDRLDQLDDITLANEIDTAYNELSVMNLVHNYAEYSI